MAEDTARAIGVGSPESIKINGKDCYPSALTILDLGEIERECLSQYRRQWIQGYVEAAEFLSDPEERKAYIAAKVEEAGKLELKSLPVKQVHETRQIELTNELRVWIEKNLSGFLEDAIPSDPTYDQKLRNAAALALDQSILSPSEYEKLAKKPAKNTKVGYVNWWTTGHPDGMFTLICHAFRKYNLSRQDIADAIGMNPGVMSRLAREIERLAAPEVGNG